MNHEYYNDLIKILRHAGKDGMAVRLIATHIYNNKAGLFSDEIDFNELYNSIRFYLWSQSQRNNSPFSKCEKRGYYKVNEEIFNQLQLDFDLEEEKTEESDNKVSPSHTGPSLFDEFL